MTYAEARQIMRRLYDERVAAQKLHEVLEKAAEAEAFFGRASSDIATAQAKIVDLEAQYKVKLSLYQEKYDAADDDLAAKKAKAKAEMASINDVISKAKTEYQASINDMTKALTNAKTVHQEDLANLQAEMEHARSTTANVVAEMESAKARFKALFG